MPSLPFSFLSVSRSCCSSLPIIELRFDSVFSRRICSTFLLSSIDCCASLHRMKSLWLIYLIKSNGYITHIKTRRKKTIKFCDKIKKQTTTHISDRPWKILQSFAIGKEVVTCGILKVSLLRNIYCCDKRRTAL